MASLVLLFFSYSKPDQQVNLNYTKPTSIKILKVNLTDIEPRLVFFLISGTFPDVEEVSCPEHFVELSFPDTMSE